MKAPFDLLIDDVLRVDVKAARLCCYEHCRGWFYRIGKHVQSDLILLWQLDTVNFYVIPWFECPRTNVTISEGGGKYARFQNNTEIIRCMLSLRKQERQHLGCGGTL